MTAYAMIYTIVVGLPLATATALGAGALRRGGREERWVWLAGLGASTMVPLLSLAERLGGGAAVGAATQALDPGPVGTVVSEGLLGFPVTVAVGASGPAPGTGAALLGVWGLLTALLTARWQVARRRLARERPTWRAGRVDGVNVYVTPDLGPAVTGLRRPAILLPEWLFALSASQRSLVVRHEAEHVRARDTVVLTVGRLARVLVPWNPLVWWLTARLRDAVELDCDRRVLHGAPDVRAYADALLTISAREPSRLRVAAAFTESETSLLRRIVMMTTPKRTVSAASAIAVAGLCVVLVLGSCEVPVPTGGSGEAASVVEVERAVNVVLRDDGLIDIDGSAHRLDEIADAMRPIVDAASRPVVVSVSSVPDASYRWVDEVQQELRGAGATRVIFDVADTNYRPPRPGGGAGLAMVLPEAGWDVPQRVSLRNLLFLMVQPSGAIDVRRGESRQLQRIQTLDVEDLVREALRQNPLLIVAVQSHPDAQYRTMLEVLAALHAANAERISLQMLEVG